MRRMQMLQEGQKTVRMTSTFRGYNHNEIISDGEMYWTKNLSGDGYPAVRPRKKRGIIDFDKGMVSTYPLNGISSLDGLVYIRGQYVYYKGNQITGITVSDETEMLPKQIVNFGAYVCIWPDLVYFSTIDETDRGTIDRKWAAKDHAWEGAIYPSAMMCRGDGTDYGEDEITVSDTAPVNPNDRDLWLDTHGENDVLRQYTAYTQEWVEVATTFVKISAEDIGKGIRQYDTVRISGLEATGHPSDKRKKQLAALNGDNIIYFCGKNYIVVAGLLSSYFNLNHLTLKADRYVPDMDYLCVSNNRMWGCKYGADRNQQRLWTGASGAVRANLCDAYGYIYEYDEITESTTEPANPQVGDLWMDISEDSDYTAHLNEYGSDYSWKRIETYVRLTATDIGKSLAEGGTVEIQGLHWPESEPTNYWLRAQIERLNGQKEIIKAYDDVIVIPGIINYGLGYGGGTPCGDYETQAQVDKKAPAGTFVNEIRACKLGDFKNWSSYMGLSTDSYTVGVGTEGPFTGAVTQWGYPIFFKEICIHKINGNTPSSFQVQTTMCKGVQQGSWRSIATANEVIYYKSRQEVMGYDGNMPISISDQLGDTQYENARAGMIGNKYYISMQGINGWNHFCYDTKRNIWYREDGLKALGYAAVGEELYAIDETNNTLIGINGDIYQLNENGELEGDLEWEAVFGISGIEFADSMYGEARADSKNQMYMSRFDIRMYLEDGAEATLMIMYDDDGEWRKQGTIRGTKTRSFMLPVIPRRCDHLRFKLTGKGDFRLYSISRILEDGSDG